MKNAKNKFLAAVCILVLSSFCRLSIQETRAEEFDDFPSLSSLPTLPYDFRGPYRETHYLKERIVFQNVKGEYMAFDVKEGGNVGLNLVWWNKWNPWGYQYLLPNTPIVYANIVPAFGYGSYKYIDGEWVYQDYINDDNSFDFYAEWVLAPGSEIRSTVDLSNLNGQVYDEKLNQWIDASFGEYMTSTKGLENYTLSLPGGVLDDTKTGAAVFVKNEISPAYICGDGIDNDGDGYVDMDDPSCHTDWDASNLLSYNPRLRSEGNDSLRRAPLLPDGTEIDYGAAHGAFTADGKIIAFTSFSINLRGGHSNSVTRNNIYVYDSSSGKTQYISKSIDASESIGSSHDPVISGDGRYVAFCSNVEKLVEDGISGEDNIYLYDRNTEKLVLISRGLDGKPAGKSHLPSISQDGRYVSFESEAENLVEDDYNGQRDIFIYEVSTGKIICASRTADDTLGNGASYSSSLNADGRYVVFLSASNNFAADDTGYDTDVFVKDLETGEVELASVSLEGSIGWEREDAYSPSISPDGRYVSFCSRSSNFAEGDVNGYSDVFLYDRNTGNLEIVSVSSDGEQSNGDSNQSIVSSNGHYMVFSSYTSNLIEKDENGAVDVFITKQETGEIRRLGNSLEGVDGNGYSYPFAITPDSKYILIGSGSSNLVVGDVNGSYDMFVVKNPFIEEYELPDPGELSQKGYNGADVEVGGILNEGMSEFINSVSFRAYIPDSIKEAVCLEIQLRKMDDFGNVLSLESVASDWSFGDKFVSIEYTPSGGLHSWRARLVDALGRKSTWVDFGDNESKEADFISSNFSFVHITDVHLGSNMALPAGMFGKDWYESQSYPRFTDILHEIEHLDPRPDFILVGGDNVEYNNERWLRDFKAIIDDYSQRTGIKIYVVPGNHDRYDSESSAAEWGETDFSGGNDKLVNYFKVMGRSEGVVSLFENDWEIMNATESRKGGLNKYNYYFYHKGLQFIGLDSGEDTGVWDIEPEGKGLSLEVVEEIEQLTDKYSDKSKIIFMHHPVYSEMKDPPYYPKYNLVGREIVIKKDQSKTDTGEVAENGGIVNNWKKFLEYCNIKNVQLVLTGHNHGDFAFDSWGNRISKAAWEIDRAYPLYIQTQSSGKDNNRGYRVVKIINGKSIPQEPTTASKKYEKVFIDLDAGHNFEWSVYDSGNEKITLENYQGGLFIAPASDRKILYVETGATRLEVKNNNGSTQKYDVRIQKRNEGGEPGKKIVSPLAYKIRHSKYCSPLNPLCFGGGMIYVQDYSDYATLDFKGFSIDGSSTHKIFVDWGDLSDFDIKKVRFGIDGDFDSSFGCMGNLVTVDLNSPGELRVYDKEGNVTGLIKGEINEEIPNSLYVPESETVFIFGDDKEIGENLKVQVVGAYENVYDLSISLAEEGEEIGMFFADDILTGNKTIHQFSVDWEILMKGGKGVRVDFDEDGDGDFERFIYSGEKLYAPKAILNSADYEGVEGNNIFFDASGSFDSDGTVVLFEWDFDGDGNYDENSQTSSIKYAYEDDFEGWMILRIKDEDGLFGLTAANVSIKNSPPQVEIIKFRKSSDAKSFILEAGFLDRGRLDSHTATVDWGDGQTENVSIEYQSVPEGAYGKIDASHTYNQLQSYVIRLKVEDNDGAFGEASHILESPRQVRINALIRLKAIKSGDKHIQKEIEKAIEDLEIYLDNKYWMDDFHLNPTYSKKFLNEEEKGIRRLERIVSKEKHGPSPEKEEIRAVLDLLSTYN